MPHGIFDGCWRSVVKLLDRWKAIKNVHNYKKVSIIPIPTKGGHFGPGRPKAVSHFHSFMTRVTKIHDFVYFSIPMVPVKPFLKKEIWNFKKLKKENLLFWHKRYLPLKKSKKFQKIVFFQTFLFYQLVSEFYMFLAFFWAT